MCRMNVGSPSIDCEVLWFSVFDCDNEDEAKAKVSSLCQSLRKKHGNTIDFAFHIIRVKKGLDAIGARPGSTFNVDVLFELLHHPAPYTPMYVDLLHLFAMAIVDEQEQRAGE